MFTDVFSYFNGSEGGEKITVEEFNGEAGNFDRLENTRCAETF